MDGNLIVYIVIVVIFFITTVLTQEKFVEEITNFQYSECEQKLERVDCKALNISKVPRQKPSLWPPGPFAIPRSSYGCPESESRGWTKSVLYRKKPGKNKQEDPLNLCVKVRNDTELDTEKWIPGIYTIYRIGEECPAGFRKSTIRESCLEYDSFGPIPNITEKEIAKEKILEIGTCKKIGNSLKGNKKGNKTTYRMLETSFIVLKSKSTPCPDKLNYLQGQNYCGIEPVVQRSLRPLETQLVLDFDFHILSDVNVNPNQVKEDMYYFDLRRSMKVYSIAITSGDGIPRQMSVSQCFHDEKRFELLFDKGLKCSYVCANQGSTFFVYLSPFRARYIVLGIEHSTEWFNKKAFHIYIDGIESLDGEMCNEDLGMRDGSIQNDQIFASSFSKRNPPFKARPSSAGWCIDKMIDANPWIMVDMRSETKIEGVTLFPMSEEVYSNAYWESFHLLYGNQMDNLSMSDVKFTIDVDKLTSGLQHSCFLQNAVTARFIMLQLNGSHEVDQPCLPFEIHGCKLSDSTELFPSFKSYKTMTTNALYVQKPSLIMSIGYPFLTGSGYSYTWIIDFKHEHYVRLIFTNVTLNQITRDNNNDCEDTLVIGADLRERLKGVQIKTNFNKRIFIVETYRTLVLLTFQPCFNTFRGSSFRAVVNEEDIPACLSIASSVDWSQGRNEVCTKPEMILTSMSILNIPFENFEERFRIQARYHHRIQIEFIDFYIVCQIGTSEIRSKFAIIEGSGEKEYCNTNKPPKIVYSEENYIHIVFRRYDEPRKKFLGREGFRLQYRTKSFTLEKWTDTETFLYPYVNSLQKSMRATQVRSKKFRKRYTVFKSSISWYDARSACWSRNEHLITIQSQKELKYINYLLREQRYDDQRIDKYDSKHLSFKAHIGLLRSIDTDKKNRFYWVNSHEVTFTAWTFGQPSVGDCIRTNFRSFNMDRTWETEDCKNELADYFICQTEEENAKLNVFNKGMCNSLSKKNKIKINYSYSGKACQRWSNVTENNHLVVDKDRNLFNINSDLCEDTSNSGIFGCNVNDSVISWEPCFFSRTY